MTDLDPRSIVPIAVEFAAPGVPEAMLKVQDAGLSLGRYWIEPKTLGRRLGWSLSRPTQNANILGVYETLDDVLAYVAGLADEAGP